jgi:DNA-binding transcriptional LysR family regulator
MNRPAVTDGLPALSARDLRAVVAVAEYSSFIAAAAALKTSQPAVTRAIKRMERSLGVLLFARSTRRVELTPAGREFVALAERLVTDLQLAVQNMRELSASQRGQVVVSTYSAFACQSLPEVLARYRESRPQLEVRLREGRQPDIVDDVRSGVADFGVGFVNGLPAALQSTVLRREPLCVIMPIDHPAARSKPRRVTLSSIAAHTIVALPGDSLSRRLVDAAAAARDLSLRYSTIVTRFESVVHYVRTGAGLGIVPLGAVPPTGTPRLHVALLSAPTLYVTVGIIRRRDGHLTPAAASLIDLIRERVSGRAPAPLSRHVRAGAAHALSS